MPKKRSSQSGSNSATAKLISKINKFGNTINNIVCDQVTNEIGPRGGNHYNYDDDDDEVFSLTAKQKLQLQRNEFLESLTKEQLKSEAKRRGQKTAGTKTELVLFSPSVSRVHMFLVVLRLISLLARALLFAVLLVFAQLFRQSD